MAKRKRKKLKKQPENPVTPEGLLPPPPVSKQQEIEAAAVANLQWCETLGAMLPKVNGVPVVQALTYELIQIVNRLALQDAGLIPKDDQNGQA